MKDTDLLERRYAVRNTFATQVSSVGDNVLISVPPDLRLRVTWVAMQASSELAENLAIVKIGTAIKYRWLLGAFMHWEILEGSLGEDLIVNLGAATPIQFNCTYEYFQ